jgi:hypothetical protein
MSDKMRWRYGDTNPVVAAVDSSTVVEIGDSVWQDVDDAKPASVCVKEGGPAESARKFRREFLGVAMQRSRSGDDCPIRVATTGVFEFDCPSDTFELGELVSPEMTDAGLSNQVVQRVLAGDGIAIARIARREPTSTTIVLVDIRSTVMIGGV